MTEFTLAHPWMTFWLVCILISKSVQTVYEIFRPIRLNKKLKIRVRELKLQLGNLSFRIMHHAEVCEGFEERTKQDVLTGMRQIVRECCPNEDASK